MDNRKSQGFSLYWFVAKQYVVKKKTYNPSIQCTDYDFYTIQNNKASDKPVLTITAQNSCYAGRTWKICIYDNPCACKTTYKCRETSDKCNYSNYRGYRERT